MARGMAMASKLTAKMKLVETALDKLIDTAMDYVKFRIQLGTLLEQTIPKAAKEGQLNGTSLADWQATAADMRPRLVNCGKWCDSHSGDLLDALDVLEAHTKTYKPEQKKKQTLRDKVMSDDMIKAREKKLAAALKLIDEARDKVKDVRKMLDA